MKSESMAWILYTHELKKIERYYFILSYLCYFLAHNVHPRLILERIIISITIINAFLADKNIHFVLLVAQNLLHLYSEILPNLNYINNECLGDSDINLR